MKINKCIGSLNKKLIALILIAVAEEKKRGERTNKQIEKKRKKRN